MRALGLLGAFIACVAASPIDLERLVNSPGHLKALGEGRPLHDIHQIEGFPYPKWFFENFVKESKPLLMKNAAKLSPAFSLWRDEYFLSRDEAADHTVTVELKKKENRTFGVKDYTFKQFVQDYNTSDIYMVNSVPPFMASDVVLPGPLQCQAMMDARILVDQVMWFSSGGTKSVVHTDSVDNINCLFRGQKKLLFVSGDYADKVNIDHPDGSYSDIDVDKADFTKYPGLAAVEYHTVAMEPGDCLYIPYMWIHQVRSFGSNIAVNVWWDHPVSLGIDLDSCPDQFSPEITFDKLEFTSPGAKGATMEAVKDYFAEQSHLAPLDFETILEMLVVEIDVLNEMDPDKNYEHTIRGIFSMLDENGDNKIEFEEVKAAKDETWGNIVDEMEAFDRMVSEAKLKQEGLLGDNNSDVSSVNHEERHDEF